MARPLATVLQLALAAWNGQRVDLTPEEWEVAEREVDAIGENEADIDAALDAEWAKRAA